VSKKNITGPHDILRGYNIKITPQRLLVYSILVNSNHHLSVDEVYAELLKTLPSVSRATVYATLECFRNHNLVKDIRIDPERSYFETRTDWHHHFLCRKCGKVFDVEVKPCSPMRKCMIEDHLIEDFQGYFYGVCKKCKGSK